MLIMQWVFLIVTFNVLHIFVNHLSNVSLTYFFIINSRFFNTGTYVHRPILLSAFVSIDI